MGIHSRAWTGLNLLNFGATPMLPMQLEQAISQASPGNEVRLESFENYPDALNFSKSTKSVGFIFLLENCGKLPTKDVFQQLSKAYETNGWSCFGVLLREKEESLNGLRTLRDVPNLLDYLPVSSILDSSETAHTMDRLWSQFVAKFERSILPQALQDTLTSLASPFFSAPQARFYDRVSAILSSTLNVSWLEQVSIRWAPTLDALQTHTPLALAQHQELMQIAKLAAPTPTSKTDTTNLQAVLDLKGSLPTRIATLSLFLTESMTRGNLPDVFRTAKTLTRPGAPAIVKHLAAAADKILSIESELESMTHERSTG